MSKEKIATAKQAMMDLIDATNTMGADQDVATGMLEALQSSHRTLQQSFFRSFQLMAVEYGDTKFTDARNDAAVAFADKIGELDHHMPFI